MEFRRRTLGVVLGNLEAVTLHRRPKPYCFVST